MTKPENYAVGNLNALKFVFWWMTNKEVKWWTIIFKKGVRGEEVTNFNTNFQSSKKFKYVDYNWSVLQQTSPWYPSFCFVLQATIQN